jgi:hypothetical protein
MAGVCVWIIEKNMDFNAVYEFDHNNLLSLE